LHLPPYENYGIISFKDIAKKYGIVILMGLLLFIILFISLLYFRKLNARLSFSNKNFLAVQSQLAQSQKMVCIGTMVAGITCEIKIPLTFAKSNIDLIKEEFAENLKLFRKCYANTKIADPALIEEIDECLADQSFDEIIGYVTQSLDNVSELLVSLKNYSSVDYVQNDLMDLHKGLDSTLLIANIGIKEVAEVEKCYGNIPKVECCPGQINQVIMNILINAVQAIEEKQISHFNNENYRGVISIETGIKKENIFLRISDNGIGIKKEFIKKVFAPTFTTKKTGMGVGLALSKQIINNHNGSIMIDSKENEGSSFVITLPIQQEKNESFITVGNT
jgi:signal transduction histidine kinase